MSRPFVSLLAPVITDYLALKRALGRGYDHEEWILGKLDAFLATSGSDLGPDEFAHWGLALEHLTSGVRRDHMRIVRNLCLYRRRRSPLCFVPDLSQFPPPHQPVQPYIFTEADIVRLLSTADKLRPSSNSPLRAQNCRLAIVLLYTTGLRRGELVRLRVDDYDAGEQTLLIRQTKFHKSRLVPLSEDAFHEVESYLAARRDRHIPCSADSPLLWRGGRAGNGYCGGGLGGAVRALLILTGVRAASGRVPRTHDFRHSFAVGALTRWYRSGVDVQAKLPLLAAYMGHVSICSTEHYLHFVESLRNSASNRFEQRFAQLLSAPSFTPGGAL
jgi:integrase/recombinase XerD